jgi:hypothetical protein
LTALASPGFGNSLFRITIISPHTAGVCSRAPAPRTPCAYRPPSTVTP